MIMTATRRPSLGLAGICGIFALAALAWVATPAQSCPPEEQEATTAHNHKHDLAADAVHVVKARNTGETGDEAGEGGEGDDATPPNDAEMADRLRRIEETQKKLAAELRELSGHMDKHGEATSAPRATQSWSSNSTTPTPSAPMATSAGMGHRSPFAQTVPGGGFATVIAGPRPGFEQPVVSRKYKLSGDRLEALTELMSRDDVPVLISPSDDGIEVQGTESQQAIFAAFIKMITANEKAAEVKLPEEKMAALKKLAALDSVPTKFQIGEDSITVQGSAAEQAVFDAFIALIHPKTTAESAGSMTRTLDVAPIPAIPPVSPFAPPATPAPAGAIKRKPKAAQPAIAPGSAAAEAAADQVASAELAKVRSDAESQLKANQDAIKKEMQVVRAGLDAKRAELKSRRADLTAQQNQLEGQADHLEAEADSVENRAKMADDANETQKLNQQAREMRRQARQSRRDATRLNTQIDKLVEAITQMEIEAAGASR